MKRTLGKRPDSPVGLGDDSASLDSSDGALLDHEHQYHHTPKALTFFSGFSNIPGNAPARCFKVGNFVQCQGFIQGPAVGAGIAIFRVDPEFLPARSPIRIAVPSRTNPSDGMFSKLLTIDAAGSASINIAVAGILWMSLFNVKWLYK